MEVKSETLADTLLITVCGSRIDAAGAIAFKDTMRDLTNDNDHRVVVDMAQVNFVDSSGLGAIVAVMKLLGSDRKMELASLSPTVEKVFKLTRMDKVFTIHPTIPQSLEGARQVG